MPDSQRSTPNNERVWQFEFLRCFACVSVVFFHATMIFAVSPNFNFLGALIRSACSTGVPLFLMTSGYFLLSNPKNTELGYFYKKRSKRIGFPLLYWSFLYVVLYTTVLKNLRNDLSWNKALDWIRTGTPGDAVHLWYLYMILGLYAATPFILTICKNYSGKVVLSICVILYAVNCVQTFSEPLFILLQFVQYAPYFIFGKYLTDKMLSYDLGRKKRNFVRATSLSIFAIVSLVETALCGKGYYEWCMSYLFPLVTVQTFSVFIFVFTFQTTPSDRTRRFLSRGASLTFGIYLSHVFFLTFFKMVYVSLGFETTVLARVITGVLTLASSVIATIIMKKIPCLRECV